MEWQEAHLLIMPELQQMDKCSPTPLFTFITYWLLFCFLFFCLFIVYYRFFFSVINKQQQKEIHSISERLVALLLLTTKCCRPLCCSVVKALMLFQQCWYPTVSNGSKVVFSSGSICIMQINYWYGSSPLRWTFCIAICQASYYLLIERYYTGNWCIKWQRHFIELVTKIITIIKLGIIS